MAERRKMGSTEDLSGMPLVQDQSSSEDELDPLRKVKEDGLNFWQAFFVISSIFSGFGTTVVIHVIAYEGWVGILILVALLVSMLYTSTLLGNCWNMVEKRWCLDRHPYGAIAYEAGGPWARTAINILVGICSFAGGPLMLLVIADLLYIVAGPSLYGTYCYWPLVFGLIICPIMWLGTPKDAWQVCAVSYITALMCFIYFAFDGLVSLDTALAIPPPTYNAWSLSLVTGVSFYIPFVHFVIPVVQRDMCNPREMNKCVVTAFAVSGGVIVCTVVCCFFAFAGLVRSSSNIIAGVSIMYVLPHRAMVAVPAVLLVIHSALAIVPQNSPMFQHIEEVLNIPEEFGWKRVVSRTVLVLLQILCAESIPQFSVLVTLLSTFASPLLIFIAPTLSYLRLRSIYMPDSSSQNPLWHKFETIACVIIIGVCPIVMAITGYAAIFSIANGATLFSTPCYVNASAAHL